MIIKKMTITKIIMIILYNLKYKKKYKKEIK